MTNLPINEILQGDCLETMKQWPDECVDLVFGSPPYGDSRTYDIGFNKTGQDWVDWMVAIYKESQRVCTGLVAFVVDSKTKNYAWSALPVLLMADLHRAGFKLRKPPLYRRNGIPGTGGPDWLANKYEFIICTTKGKLPWSDNTACGHPPKWTPGGECTNRDKGGVRSNKTASRNRRSDGSREQRAYFAPGISNPGNIVDVAEDVVDCGTAGGGHIGHKLAHENEAPFPEKLAEFFIKSFCKPDGIVVDPFSGSGTTASVAVQNNRNFIGIDIRQSQVDLATTRLIDVCNKMLA